MSRIIAGIYEIECEIGSGGGGIVYLGRHLRLNKQVVLKADKRTLSAGTEKLRREADLLKNLSHTYIPKVYDFVQSEGVVYTVMDYIEGESLDKLLKRKQLPTQPQAICWACQLLEALKYLHGYPPYGILHSDIKPANIMLRPDGTICLIDFNIALALGESGAVKVGHSRGYASPEHYGVSDIQVRQKAANSETEKTQDDTDGTLTDTDRTLPDSDITVKGTKKPQSVVRSTTDGQNVILLDARSDIYSLGATLYHLLSGRRPDQDASKVVPLGSEVCSPEISKIIQKAMAPAPEERYQTTEEMLTAFRQLHKMDERAVRHRRHEVTAAVLWTAFFLAGGVSTFIGLKQLEQRQKALTLAEYSANALAEGKVTEAAELALQAIPSEKSILEAPVTAQAQMALTDVLGVYDLSDGFKALDVLELQAVPFDVAVSPGERYFAVTYAYEMAVFDMETREQITVLPIQNSALSDVVFADDSKVIYAGNQGITAYDLETQKILWSGEPATMLSISEDRSMVAAVNRDDDHAVIYQVSDGEKAAVCEFDGRHIEVPENDIFADAGNYLFSLNKDGSMLAVGFSNGGLLIFDTRNPGEQMIVSVDAEQSNFNGGFCGKYFAYRVMKDNCWSFQLIDTEKASFEGGYESKDKILVSVNEQGIYVANGNLLVSLNPETLEETELAYTEDSNIVNFVIGNAHTLVATEKPDFSFYDSAANLMSAEICSEVCNFLLLKENYAVIGNQNEPSLRILRLENHKKSQLMKYDARYPHDEARISSNGKTAMLFSIQGFQIYDMSGSVLAEVSLPEPEKIYDQQFVKKKESSWLEVTWYDGMKRCYSADDGKMISEEQGEKPEKDLYEEFYIEGYRIASSLHEAPKVYELESNRLAATLEEDSYLTYVTELNDYIITEYISAAGERYGLLLNRDFEKLAYLPKLCDVSGDKLVFDDEAGNLRQCRLYSLQELIASGETLIEK